MSEVMWARERPRLDRSAMSAEEWELRVELAAAFRLAAAFEWTESVGNHFSVTLPGGGTKFLMNPRWLLFSEIRASDLMLLDWTETDRLAKPNPPDRSGWCIHSRIHALNPQAKVVMHLHPPHATALSGLADPTLMPIDQVTARFFGGVAYDRDFENVAITTAEGDRLAGLLGDKTVLMMGCHGVTVVGTSIPMAFEDLYLFERACRTLVLAYGTGQKLNVMSDKIATQVAAGWKGAKKMAPHHFHQLRFRLDRDDPTYAE